MHTLTISRISLAFTQRFTRRPRDSACPRHRLETLFQNPQKVVRIGS